MSLNKEHINSILSWNYLWNKSLTDQKCWDRPQLSLAKTETKGLNIEKKLMTIVLGGWVLTTNSIELEIGNWSKRDLDVENLNLDHEKM